MSYKYDFAFEQGTTLALDITCMDEDNAIMDLTGYSARAQLRYRYADPLPAAVFTALIVPSLGEVSLSLSPEQTSALSRKIAYWDCELASPDGIVQRLAQGRVTISPEVTK